MMWGVHISKPILYAACAVFLVLVSVVSFLIGRETRRRDPAPAAVVATPSASQVAPQQPPPAHATPPVWAPTPSPVDPYVAAPVSSPVDPYARAATSPAAATPLPMPSPAPQAALDPGPAPSPAPASAPQSASRADAIRSYFISVAAIQTYAATGDSTQLAQQLLASAAGGDSSGFDQIVASARQGMEKARALQPPSECTAYHTQLLALLGDGVTLMTQLKTAIARSDTGALTSIASSGSSLQARAQALAAEERSIKSRAGVF